MLEIVNGFFFQALARHCVRCLKNHTCWIITLMHLATIRAKEKTYFIYVLCTCTISVQNSKYSLVNACVLYRIACMSAEQSQIFYCLNRYTRYLLLEYTCSMKSFLDTYAPEKVSADNGRFCLLGLKTCGTEMFCCGGCLRIVIYMDMRLDEQFARKEDWHERMLLCK